MRATALMLVTLTTAVTACSPRAATVADVTRYTGLRLCDGAVVRDLTTPEERDTTPGFSFHVEVVLPPACQGDFERQLSTLAGGRCGQMDQAAGCFIPDASVHGAAKRHTSITASPLGGARYDLRFYS